MNHEHWTVTRPDIRPGDRLILEYDGDIPDWYEEAVRKELQVWLGHDKFILVVHRKSAKLRVERPSSAELYRELSDVQARRWISYSVLK